jgi:uncharacterized protein with HEPN domain
MIARRYGKVNLHALWETLVVDIPEMRALCEQSLRKLGLR